MRSMMRANMRPDAPGAERFVAALEAALKEPA